MLDWNFRTLTGSEKQGTGGPYVTRTPVSGVRSRLAGSFLIRHFYFRSAVVAAPPLCSPWAGLLSGRGGAAPGFSGVVALMPALHCGALLFPRTTLRSADGWVAGHAAVADDRIFSADAGTNGDRFGGHREAHGGYEILGSQPTTVRRREKRPGPN